MSMIYRCFCKISLRGYEAARFLEAQGYQNVTVPTLVPMFPRTDAPDRTAVIICPGGAFHFLCTDYEGTDVAAWLNAQGIACFILRYRLAPTPKEDAEFLKLIGGNGLSREVMRGIKAFSGLALEDGPQAVRWVRGMAAELGIRKDRIGMVGFSAGAMVTGSTAMCTDATGKPDFAGVIYDGPVRIGKIPREAPPLFLAYADGDDVVGDNAFKFFNAWNKAGRPAELHVYSKGGHGFGMKRQGLGCDHWIEQLAAWMKGEGMMSGSSGPSR